MEGNMRNEPDQLLQGFQESIQVRGDVTFEVTRHNGVIETNTKKNIVLSVGLDYLASRGVANTASAMAYIAVGTETAAHSLASVNFGEVARKICSISAASHEVMVFVNTYAGAADGVTSLVLGSAAVCNHASSGQGTNLNMVNGLSTTLGNSDYLRVQVEIRVGSH